MALSNMRIVLVEPLYGGNIGAACRAMANMGFSDLALVAPRAPDMNEARMMACHAGHVLDARKEYDTLAGAVADCGAVMGTTARRGLYRQHARAPREWAERALEAADSGRVALVFGREDKGLTNEELALCTHIVQIPTAPECSSLNIAQAVLICCYEIFVAFGTFVPQTEKSPDAPSALRERMFEIWRDSLLEIGFMRGDKADHMMMGVRRILSRGRLTVDDVNIMMGIARQAVWAARKGRRPAPARKGPARGAGPAPASGRRDPENPRA